MCGCLCDVWSKGRTVLILAVKERTGGESIKSRNLCVCPSVNRDRDSERDGTRELADLLSGAGIGVGGYVGRRDH